MAEPLLAVMTVVVAAICARVGWTRRRRLGEPLGQWRQRVRRRDASGEGAKDLMLFFFSFGLLVTAGVFYFAQEVEFELPEKMLLGVLCASLTIFLPLLIWLVGKEGAARLAEEDRHWQEVEDELSGRGGAERMKEAMRRVREGDDEDLDGR